MIVGALKPIAEIREKISPYRRILVLGCGGCVAVCHTGGERQAEELALLLRAANPQVATGFASVPRQCEDEFLSSIAPDIRNWDAVLSLACGVGVQALAAFYPDMAVFPGINTSFMGMPVRHGVFEERCAACGDCILDLTGGICPVARCSKSLLNGPCGGSQNGVCEISPDLPCAWQLIYDRLAARGELGRLEKIFPPKNWRSSRDGGPRRMAREDLVLDGNE